MSGNSVTRRRKKHTNGILQWVVPQRTCSYWVYLYKYRKDLIMRGRATTMYVYRRIRNGNGRGSKASKRRYVLPVGLKKSRSLYDALGSVECIVNTKVLYAYLFRWRFVQYSITIPVVDLPCADHVGIYYC